ncbi:MAG: hypothetical protein U0973_06570, partial [Xanthomonadaceae bacterium]|nr:hypothetical protein [Xanthomonadaceae bacterium]
TDQQQQQQQSAARRTTKRTAKAKTAAAVLDNRLLIEGWVERSETHQARCNGLVDGFRSLRDSVRCANYAFVTLGRCALFILRQPVRVIVGADTRAAGAIVE